MGAAITIQPPEKRNELFQNILKKNRKQMTVKWFYFYISHQWSCDLTFKTFEREALTHSLIHHFEIVPNSKTLQTTTKMWLLKNLNIQIA